MILKDFAERAHDKSSLSGFVCSLGPRFSGWHEFLTKPFRPDSTYDKTFFRVVQKFLRPVCTASIARACELLSSQGTLQGKHVRRIGYHLYISYGCENPILTDRRYARNTAYRRHWRKLNRTEPLWQMRESNAIPFKEESRVAPRRKSEAVRGIIREYRAWIRRFTRPRYTSRSND